MDKLEQLHLDAIDNNICSESNYTKILGKNEAASKSAEITKQIAIEFVEWCRKNAVHKRYDIWFYANNDYAIHELFQVFLKTRQ